MKRMAGIVVLAVLGLMLVGVSPTVAGESYLDTPGKDYSYTGPGHSWHRVAVNASDTVDFSWTGTGSFYVCFDFPLGWLCWTGLGLETFTSSDAGYYAKTYLTAWNPPANASMVMAGTGVVQFYLYTTNPVSITFNISITPAPLPPPPDDHMDEIRAGLDALWGAVNATDSGWRANLSAAVGSLRDELHALDSGVEWELLTLYDRLTDLNASLTRALSTLRADAGKVDAALLDDIKDLTGIIGSMTAYNDTPVWEAIGAIEPVTYNNTTVLNQTIVNQTIVNQTSPVAYVNTTRSLSTPTDLTGPTVAGAALGVGSVLGGIVLANTVLRRREENELTPVQPPEAGV